MPLKVFASASAGGHFTSTTVTPVGGTEAIEDLSSTSFGFAITVMAGGGLELTTHFTQDEKSGSEADETDTYDFFDLKDTIEYGGSTGFNFYVAAGTGEESDETTDDTVPSESDTREPAIGEQTAQELLAGKSNGMQVSFSVNGSSSYDSNHTIENKNRWGDSASEDGSHGFEEMSYSKVSNGNSGGNAIVQLGTDAMLISVGASGGSSNTENSSFTTYDLSASDGDTAIMSTDAGFSETSSSAYKWGLTIGGETGFELIDEGSYDVNVSITEEGITSFNGYLTGFASEVIYIDYSEDEEDAADDDSEQTGGSPEERPERVHRLTHTQINGADRTDEIIFENAPAGAVADEDSGDQVASEEGDDTAGSGAGQVVNSDTPASITGIGPWFFASKTRPQILDRIPIITRSMLPQSLPTGTIDSKQTGNQCWSGHIPGGTVVGPFGMGPCVGLVLRPVNLNGLFHSYHFGEADDLTAGLIQTGALQYTIVGEDPSVGPQYVQEPSEQFIAYLAGGSDDNKLREAIDLLRSHDIKIGGYLPCGEFRIDGNGQLYWTHLATNSTVEFE